MRGKLNRLTEALFAWGLPLFALIAVAITLIAQEANTLFDPLFSVSLSELLVVAVIGLVAFYVVRQRKRKAAEK